MFILVTIYYANVLFIFIFIKDFKYFSIVCPADILFVVIMPFHRHY